VTENYTSAVVEDPANWTIDAEKYQKHAKGIAQLAKS
jgi:hypothetical protein